MGARSTFHACIAAALVAGCAGAPSGPDAALDDLFAAERAFAKDSTERGMRAAFLDHFAADGLDFRPGPGVMRERMRARPAPADPLALVLDWSPQAGAVARAGDLGYTTGPFSLSNQREASVPARYGYFFSVWRRENGVWRVALDAGVSTPAAPPPDSLAAPVDTKGRAVFMAGAGGGRGKEALLALERGARSLDPDPAETASYFELLANSARILREGSYAIVGADAARRALAATGRRVVWTPSDGGASASDDLGFTYGRFARFFGSSEESSGYYVHVWQRDASGAWRITAEVQLPPE